MSLCSSFYYSLPITNASILILQVNRWKLTTKVQLQFNYKNKGQTSNQHYFKLALYALLFAYKNKKVTYSVNWNLVFTLIGIQNKNKKTYVKCNHKHQQITIIK